MIQKGIGFNALQEGTKISKSTLSPLINSEDIPKKTKLETLERVADFLDVTMLSLLEKEITTVDNFIYDEEKSKLTNNNICYSFEHSDLHFELDIQSYEVNNKQEYYLFLILQDYKKSIEESLLSAFVKSSYNEISYFMELSLNRLGLELSNLNSSIIPIELQFPLANDILLSAQRTSMYTTEHKFFNLPRKEGNEFKTIRHIYEF